MVNWMCNIRPEKYMRQYLHTRILQLFALHEKYPYSEFFWSDIFQRLDRIQKDTDYLSVFSPNAGKYGPKTPNTDTFCAVLGYS